MVFSLFQRKTPTKQAHQAGEGPFAVGGNEPLSRDGRLTHSEESRLYDTY